MPGLLRADAECPKCGAGLAYLDHIARPDGTTTATYFHAKAGPKARRMRPCRVTGRTLMLDLVRESLEVPRREQLHTSQRTVQ